MTKKWQQFKDRRNSSIEMATYFALSMDLDGINVHAEDIIENRSLIKFVKSKNLVLFCWGEDLNRKELISELKKEGVDGVIYDKYVFNRIVIINRIIVIYL
jgi:glycerophosphocholine phosphodiesterase GPCPD1